MTEPTVTSVAELTADQLRGEEQPLGLLTAEQLVEATVVVPTSSVRPHPENANQGSVGAIRESLRTHGQYRTIVVQKSTGYVLAGNTTWRAAQEEGRETIAVIELDVDDDRARRILLVDNRSAQLGDGYDDMALAELLRQVQASEDWSGTGWVEEDLHALLEELGDALDPGGADALARELEPRDTSVDGDGGEETPRSTLADRFIVPPFSVLDARQGGWRTRKQHWLAYGIQSELGRGEGMTYTNQGGIADIQSGWGVTPTKKAGGPHPGGGGGGAWLGRRSDGAVLPADAKWGSGSSGSGGLTMASASGRVPTYYAQKNAAEARLGRELSHEEFTRDHLDASGATENLSTSGTSVFDPVLVELAVRWFSPPGGHVLDPFAGGSVRGLVTALLGRSYEGIELREEQVEANRAQAHIAGEGADLTWVHGDSNVVLDAPGRPADLVFSCPPYAYLERYSDDPADLSTMSAEEFRRLHAEIIRKAVDRLAPNRYAVWVIGDVRVKNRDGRQLGLIRDTIDAFEAAGCGFYNEAIYVTPVGSLAVRAGRQFQAGRKLGRTHQHVLVFIKGDGMQAARDSGPVVVDVPEAEEPDAEELAARAAEELADGELADGELDAEE